MVMTTDIDWYPLVSDTSLADWYRRALKGPPTDTSQTLQISIRG
jgi:hypothetical protein